jgi:hypothetical protein
VDKALPPPLYCDTTSCDLDPLFCSQDRDESGNPFTAFDKRDLTLSSLEKRGPQRNYEWKTAAGHFVRQSSLIYPTLGMYIRHLQAGLQGLARRWWRMRSQSCDDPVVSPEPLDENEAAPEDAQVEHPVPVRSICSSL